MKFTTTAAAAGVALMMAGGASAATLTSAGTTCSVSGSDSDFTIGSVNASQCEGAFGGNDSNTDLNGIFGISGWTEIVKVDDSSGVNTGNNVELTVTTNNMSETSGTWSVNSWGGFTTVMGVLKGGSTFSAYLLDVEEGEGGNWNTNGILTGGGNAGPGLSHMTLYSVEGDTTVVPLPAAGWLMLAGLGGLAVMRRRKKAA